MRIRLTIDERDEVQGLFDDDDERTSLMQRFGPDEKGEMTWVTYTEFMINYGEEMTTWMDNLRQIIKALEKHYGYKFDLSKLTKNGVLYTEDPDHVNEWAE